MLHDIGTAFCHFSSSSSSSSSPVILCPNPCHPVSCTTDGWSGPDHESYLCLTVHWFDSDWKFQRSLLDIMMCSDRHTGENLCEWTLENLSNNEISVCWFGSLPSCSSSLSVFRMSGSAWMLPRSLTIMAVISVMLLISLDATLYYVLIMN